MHKLILKILSLLILGCAASSCQRNSSDASAEEFQTLIEHEGNALFILDVRSQGEYNTGHISNAVNVNMLNDSFVDIVSELVTPKQTIALYCKSGRRSASAARKLAKKGYHVVNLKEGILGWEDSGRSLIICRQ